MINEKYNLPTVAFYAGESQPLTFNLVDEYGQAINTTDCSFNLSIIQYLNPNTEPLITKTVTLSSATDIADKIVFQFEPEDTMDINGEFIYQVAIATNDGELVLPGQGILKIYRNINKGFSA